MSLLNFLVGSLKTYNSSELKLDTESNPSNSKFINTIYGDWFGEEQTIGDEIHITKAPKPDDTETTSSPDNKKLSGEISFVRNDGIKFELKDTYTGDIDDDDNAEAINSSMGYVGNFANPTISITDKAGKKYTFRTSINNCDNMLDLRREERAIATFFEKLSTDEILKLINNNVTDISFSDTMDEDFSDLYHLDDKGEEILISDNLAEIISPTFAPPKRNYKTEHNFERSDNYKIQIKDSSATSSDLIITTPDGKQHNISITSANSCNTDIYHQRILPNILKTLEEVPTKIIQDVLSEIHEIKVTKDARNAGVYAKNSNTLSIDYDTNPEVIQNIKLTFIHELGHAIDNLGNDYISEDSDFVNKFEEFTKLAQKYEYESLNDKKLTFDEYQYGKESGSMVICFRNHALDNEKEFFASMYADMNYSSNDDTNNHIAKLDKIILPFEDSQDVDKQRCYQLYQELKNHVKSKIERVRTSDTKERSDDTIKNYVKANGNEAIKNLEILENEGIVTIVADSPELTLLNTVSRNDKEFEEIVTYYEKISQSEQCPENAKKALSSYVEELRRLKSGIKDL